MGRKDKTVASEDIDAQQPGTIMRQARQSKHVPLTSMAAKVGCSKSYLSQIETNRLPPPPQLVKQYELLLELESGTLPLTGNGSPLRSRKNPSSRRDTLTESTTLQPVTHVDLSDAPSVSDVYGRQQELAALERWLVVDRCTLVSVLGFGGIGKTTLAAHIADRIARGDIHSDFDYVFWCSLHSAPPLERVLEQAMHFIAEGRSDELPEGESNRIDDFLSLLSQDRCLIVLDNFESVLASNNPVGHYTQGYADYASLLQRVGEGKHQSCLLLTSREKPGELIPLEGRAARVRSMTLQGMMDQTGIRAMLKEENLEGSDEIWNDLINRYSGNPLALKLISAHIRDIFDGDIPLFLQQGEEVFGDISTFIARQFQRLSPPEQAILYWLAITCEPVRFDALKQHILNPTLRNTLALSLESLRRRFLIEVLKGAYFELQPVIAGYVLKRFLDQVYEEITSGNLDLFANYMLINAQARDHVRADQRQRVLQPIADYLLNQLSRSGAEATLKHLLSQLREKRAQTPDYAPGNILNLLIYLKNGHLEHVDCSHLAVRQAYLAGVTLHHVNFTSADLHTSVFTQNFDAVASMALSPDETLLATGTITGEIWLWNAVTGDLKFSLKSGESSWVTLSVAFSSQGNLLAAGSEDHSISLWDVSTGEHLQTLNEHTGCVRSVAFCPSDGNLLASGSDDHTIRFWHVNEGRCFKLLQAHTDCVNILKFNQDGSLLASASSDTTIHLWNVSTGESIRTLNTQSGGIFALAFTPDGKAFVTGGDDAKLYVWNVADGRNIAILKGHTDRIRSLAIFGPDNDYTIASGSEDRTVRIWEMKSGTCLRILQDHSDRIWSLVFNRTENTLITSSTDQTILFWSLSDGHYLKRKTLQGHMNAIRSLAFNPKTNLLASSGEDNSIYLWDVAKETHQLSRILRGHLNWIWSLAFTPDGDRLASGGDDKIIRIWGSKSNAPVQTLTGHSSWIRSLAFSPDGRLLASGSVGHTIRLWDVSTGSFLSTLSGHTNRVRSLAFSPDGQWLASGSDDNTVLLWKATPGAHYIQDRPLRGHTQSVWCVAFSPDGQWLASASNDRTIRLWPLSGRRSYKVLNTEADWTGSLAFSPDGELLASAGSDKTIQLWDLRSGSLLTHLQDHKDVIYAVAFNSDGTLLASAGREGVIKLWDAHSYANLQTLRGNRPYEHTNIAHVSGLNRVQIEVLKALGAVEESG
jgi:WD40 repeat protein/transcriptional regulator with XRE-family HTH domain